MRWRRRSRRGARDLGLEVAVGLEPPAETRPGRTGIDRRCPQCARPGRMDMVDATEQRGYLSCAACGCSWESDPARLPTR